MSAATPAEIRAALEIGQAAGQHARRTIDITTLGATSGRPRRIEIWFWEVDGHWYLSSEPGPRSWFANLRAHPEFSVHLTGSVRADISARAEVITDPAVRRRVLPEIIRQSASYTAEDVEPWIRSSPLIEFRPQLDEA